MSDMDLFDLDWVRDNHLDIPTRHLKELGDVFQAMIAERSAEPPEVDADRERYFRVLQAEGAREKLCDERLSDSDRAKLQAMLNGDESARSACE